MSQANHRIQQFYDLAMAGKDGEAERAVFERLWGQLQRYWTTSPFYWWSSGNQSNGAGGPSVDLDCEPRVNFVWLCFGQGHMKLNLNLDAMRRHLGTSGFEEVQARIRAVLPKEKLTNDDWRGLPLRTFASKPELVDALCGVTEDLCQRLTALTGDEVDVPPLQPSADSEVMVGDIVEEGRRYSARRGSQGGESDEHRMLKEWVTRHPQKLGIDATTLGQEEYLFISGDRCDVVFLDAEADAVVEVKVRERDELIRGVYQAVKYRALLEAEQGNGEPLHVSAVLAAFEIPRDVSELAARLGVEVRVVEESEVLNDRRGR